jgi:pyrroloquinoline-quinone synthase
VDTYWDAARNAPVAAGVAALYAYESQLPAVSDAKIAGLQAHYGITSGSGLTFFEVHRAIDVHHAAAERRILERAPATEQAAVVSSTERALESWWGFLSGFGVDDAACA